MEPDDVVSAARIEQAVSPHPWREIQFYESQQRDHSYVMVEDQAVIGFMIYTLIGPESEILNIAIDPDYHNKGLGTYLLARLIEQVSETAERLYLEVRVSNFPAIRLYQNAGFAELCIRENYYPTAHGREDAIMMALELGDY